MVVVNLPQIWRVAQYTQASGILVCSVLPSLLITRERVSRHGFRKTTFMCSTHVSSHSFKNDKYVTDVACFRLMALRKTYFMCSVLVWPRGELNCKHVQWTLVTTTRFHRIQWSSFADI